MLRPVLTTLISKLAGIEQGFAMGMNNAYMSIGNVLGPLLAGILFDVTIIYPFFLGLIVLILTTIRLARWKARKNINALLTGFIDGNGGIYFIFIGGNHCFK